MVSQLDRVPKWVFGPTVHPFLQFVRDFVLHRIGYRRTLFHSACHAYMVALARRHNAGKISDELMEKRISKVAAWMDEV